MPLIALLVAPVLACFVGGVVAAGQARSCPAIGRGEQRHPLRATAPPRLAHWLRWRSLDVRVANLHMTVRRPGDVHPYK